MEPVPTEEPDEEHRVFNIDSTSGSFESDHDSEQDSYHDESESDDHEYGQVSEENAAIAAGGRRLKSMGIMMGDEFDEIHSNESCCSRFWFCWACCTIVGITMFLVVQGSLEYQKQAALLYGKDPLYGDYETAECKEYGTQTLQLIEDHMNNASDTSTFCVPEKIHDCQCKHPYQPNKPKDHISMWAEIETMNVNLVETYTKKKHLPAGPDVAFLGDSIVEHFNGLDLGYTGGKWKANKRVFDKVFNRKNGGKVNGVALGVGGDRIQNLLYRLQNGEGPALFHPKVWWILIGTNDLVDNCNADTIAVGNFRIVEEIRRYHPAATVVLNSILPRNEVADDLLANPLWNITQEINLKMECYAKSHKNVEFFNATKLFTYKSRGKIVVNPQLMKDQVHPNAEGSRLWSEAMADRVVELKNIKRHRDHKDHYQKTHHSGVYGRGGSGGPGGH